MGVRIDRVPNVIVAGVCLFNFALDQGEDPDIEELDEDGEEEEDLNDREQNNIAQGHNDAARLAQGIAHRQWLVDTYCQN